MTSTRLTAIALLLVVTGCSGDDTSSYAPPSREDPTVTGEERRLATLLAAPGVIVHAGGQCAVRLMGTDGDTSARRFPAAIAELILERSPLIDP